VPDFARSFRAVTLATLCVAAQSHADCLDDAALYHGVHPALARAIALQESQMHPEVISAPNSNGSYDIGLMQINSAWLPKLARWGISKSDLLNGCVNAYVGTWILSQNIERLGQTWDAIGAYNANSPEKRLVYARSIYRRLQQLAASQQLTSMDAPATSPVTHATGSMPVKMSLGGNAHSPRAPPVSD